MDLSPHSALSQGAFLHDASCTLCVNLLEIATQFSLCLAERETWLQDRFKYSRTERKKAHAGEAPSGRIREVLTCIEKTGHMSLIPSPCIFQACQLGKLLLEKG